MGRLWSVLLDGRMSLGLRFGRNCVCNKHIFYFVKKHILYFANMMKALCSLLFSDLADGQSYTSPTSNFEHRDLKTYIQQIIEAVA